MNSPAQSDTLVAHIKAWPNKLSLGEKKARQSLKIEQVRTALWAAGLQCPLSANSGHQAASLDHLVGGREQRLRHFNAQSFGGNKVNHKIKFGGMHDRKISYFFAL